MLKKKWSHHEDLIEKHTGHLRSSTRQQSLGVVMREQDNTTVTSAGSSTKIGNGEEEIGLRSCCDKYSVRFD